MAEELFVQHFLVANDVKNKFGKRHILTYQLNIFCLNCLWTTKASLSQVKYYGHLPCVLPSHTVICTYPDTKQIKATQTYGNT